MSQKSSRRRTVVVAVVALVVVAAGIFILTRPKKAKYRTSRAQLGNVTISVSATGTLNPVNQVTVGSQVSGTILKTYFDFNDHVKAGQILATIDPRNYESALKQAQANLASARATLNQDKLTAARAETLYANGLMAYSDYLQAETNAEVDTARLQQAQANYDQAQTNLAYTTIVAPMSGIVVARQVEAGQTVAASFQAPELFNIADLSLMQVEVSIDEADVGKLDTGLTASFNVDAYPESSFTGTLVQIRNQPVVSSNVTTYVGIVRVANPAMLLKPGMTANVKITVKEVDNVLTVPNAALSSKLATTLGFASTARTRTSRELGAVSASSVGAPSPAAAGTRGQRAGRGSGGRGSRRGAPAGASVAESGRASVPAETTITPAVATPETKTIFVFDGGRPVPRQVQVGLSDATSTEILSGLSEGEIVVTGIGGNGAAAVTQNRGSPFGGGGFGAPPRGGH
jgi:HlyD family secretion protein